MSSVSAFELFSHFVSQDDFFNLNIDSLPFNSNHKNTPVFVYNKYYGVENNAGIPLVYNCVGVGETERRSHTRTNFIKTRYEETWPMVEVDDLMQIIYLFFIPVVEDCFKWKKLYFYTKLK